MVGKIQRYYGGYPADNRGCALQRVIRNIKSEKFFFVGLGHAIDVSVCEYHENVPYNFSSGSFQRRGPEWSGRYEMRAGTPACLRAGVSRATMVILLLLRSDLYVGSWSSFKFLAAIL